MRDEKNLKKERRRHVRKNTPSTPVAIRDAHGHTWEGRVLDLSVGGVSIASESDAASSVLEIRPSGSTAWVKVLVKNRESRPSLWVFGCAFSFPPAQEVFEALSGHSLQSRTAKRATRSPTPETLAPARTRQRAGYRPQTAPRRCRPAGAGISLPA